MSDGLSSTPRIFSETELRHLLALEVQRCTRYQDFLSLCLIRAAHSGAPAADRQSIVILRIAEMLRSTDLVGVIGPDIAVLLVHTTDTDAALIAERIRDRVESDRSEGAPAPSRPGLGIGLASFPTDATSDADLLAHAQLQLQAALSAQRP